jgi:hypothetical protein
MDPVTTDSTLPVTTRAVHRCTSHQNELRKRTRRLGCHFSPKVPHAGERVLLELSCVRHPPHGMFHVSKREHRRHSRCRSYPNCEALSRVNTK